MEIKNLENIISECVLYSDNITKNPEFYPQEAKMPLKDLMRYDMLMMLGHICDVESPELPDQIEYIKLNLKMAITEDKFVEFIMQKCNDEEFFTRQPKSLDYFIAVDKKERKSNDISVSKSKFVVDTLRKLGEGFLNYEAVNPAYKEYLSGYIAFLNDILVKEGISKVRLSKMEALKAEQEEREAEKERDRKNPDKITTFDAESGRFFTKETIQTSGYNLIKKRADDISEYENFLGDENDDTNKRGKNKVGGNRHDDLSDEIEKSLDELIAQLQDLTGLAAVKQDVIHIINMIKVRKLREIKGYKCPEMSFHLVFTGNPGTGKTTVARLLAKIYKQLGVVSRGQFIEVDRSGLVDHSIGGTAIKTSKVIDKAVGGILFIDEAYTLTSYKDVGDYGQEAVDTLLKRMEDDRDDLIVIVAGYTGPMHNFIESNPGLRSRFNKYIFFTDYTSTELMKIFRLMCKEKDYMLTENAAFIAETYLRGISESKQENFANARLVRNYFERCVDRQASRVVADPEINEDDLITFIREDMIEGAGENVLTKNEDADL